MRDKRPGTLKPRNKSERIYGIYDAANFFAAYICKNKEDYDGGYID